MARSIRELKRDARRGKLSRRTVTWYLNQNLITETEADELDELIRGYEEQQELAASQQTVAVPEQISVRGLLRAMASGTAFTSDQWREFILKGPDRALPELEGDRLNVAHEKNISFLLDLRAQIRARIQAGELDELVAEVEAPMDQGGWTNGDFKWMYKAIASNSQRNIFLGKVADATADGKAIDSAIGSNFGVYSQWLWHFSRWGQTWGTICPSFLGLVGLVKKIREGSLEAKDVWDYRDKDAFQATFEELEDQQYLQDLRAWDPDEFALLHPQDLAGNRPAGEPLFWSEPLAEFMTQEVFGGVIVITKDNFLQHKDLAEEVRTKQKAIRRALHVVEHYVDEPQRSSFLPDLKLSSIAGLVTGLVVGAFGAVLVGLPMDQGRSYISVGILALVCWWAASQLRRRLGVVESLLASITALVGGFGTIWIVGSTKATYLRKGLPMVQANLAILTKLFKLWGWTLPIALVLFLIIRKSKGD